MAPLKRKHSTTYYCIRPSTRLTFFHAFELFSVSYSATIQHLLKHTNGDERFHIDTRTGTSTSTHSTFSSTIPMLNRLEDIVIVGVFFMQTFRREMRGDVVILLLYRSFVFYFFFAFILDISTRKYHVILITVILSRYTHCVLSYLLFLCLFFYLQHFIFMTFGIREFIGTQLSDMNRYESFFSIHFFSSLLFIRL